MKVLASISVGELFDKLSILQIKREKILNPTKLNNVKKHKNTKNNIKTY